jgi:mono/diheme cytochrome c family protein
MKPPGARPSRRCRCLALLLAIALLAPTWRPAMVEVEHITLGTAPMQQEAAQAHGADCVDCQTTWPSHRGSARVHALAQCGACHLPQARGDASSLMLARVDVERVRVAAQSTAPTGDDEAGVRAGSEVYRHACTRCHERDAPASSSGAPRPLGVSIDDGRPRTRAGAAPEPALSDERMAALAAFLRRHASTLPWLDGVRAARDATL